MKSKAYSCFLHFCMFCLVFAALLPAPAYAFGEFTIKDEFELGSKFNVLVHSRMPLVLDPEVVNYANYLLTRLQKGMPPQPFIYKVSILQSNAINAFAVPGGYIYIHTGLFISMNDEAEVAGVLAHEMAHVSQRHIASRIEKAQKVSLLSTIGMLAGAFLGGDAAPAAIYGAAAASQTAMLSYSRADEADADQVGMSYLVTAGYPPIGMVNAFKVLQRPQWITGSDFPAYLSSHPAIAERISDMASRIESMPVALKQRQTDNIAFLRVQALVRGRYGEPKAAMQFFTEQAKGHQKALAYFGMAVLYDRQNKVTEATAYFDKAMKEMPSEQLFIREAGRFHYLKGNKQKASQYLQRATAMNKHDYLGLYFYARLLNDTGARDKAQEYYKVVLRYVPEDSEVHYYYAQSLGQSKKLFKAHLHLAYSALYENNRTKTAQALQKATPMAKTEQEKQELEKFNRIYEERRKFWGKSS